VGDQRSESVPNFGLPPKYKPRLQPRFDNHDGLAELGVVFQPDVYDLAAFLARGTGCRYLVDVGCGHADKICQRHGEFEVIGLDTPENVAWCRDHFSFGQWLPVNLEEEQCELLPEEVLNEAVIICADVIEHMIDPLPLVRTLRGWLSRARYCVLSTPDRHLVRGRWHQGPPKNPCHVREWKASELKRFLESQGLDAWVGLSRSVSHKEKMHTVVSVLMNPAKYQAAARAA